MKFSDSDKIGLNNPYQTCELTDSKSDNLDIITEKVGIIQLEHIFLEHLFLFFLIFCTLINKMAQGGRIKWQSKLNLGNFGRNWMKNL